MPSYKLTYFSKMACLGEPIRFLFSYAGIEFIDNRIDRLKNWSSIKPSMPFGQVPILEVDGKIIHQSVAICRYLAKQFKLAGKDDWEALEIDATVDTIHDIRLKIRAYHYEQNPDAKAQKLEVMNEVVPFLIDRLDKQVVENGGYFVSGKLSWADIVFVALLNYNNFRANRDIIEKAVNLKKMTAAVLAEPGIKAWVDKYPVTDE